MKAPRLLIASLILLQTGSLIAQTSVPGGEIYGTWSVSGSPYLIEGDITIPNDSTLRIEPGVKVEFQGHYAMVVLGRLLAIGTGTDSILFTVNDTTGFSKPDTSLGGWYGIRFLDTPTSNDSSKISYCKLEYGKAVGPVWFLNAGGAICILQFGKVLISDCLIRNCTAGSTTQEAPIGGGLYLFRSDVIVRNNTFVKNTAHSGGAIFFDESDAVFKDNVIKNNHAIYGGGIAIGATSNPTFAGDKILDNVAESHGGGVLFSSSSVKFENLIVSGNSADWGGGIGVQGGELQANGCRFENNFAEIWGGGIACDFGTLYLDHCSFINDSSGLGSGGLHMDHAVANISGCEFSENRAAFGGAFHGVFSKITCSRNDFIENHADGSGGIHIQDSDCTIDLCLFRGNRATNGATGAIDYSVDSTIFGRPFLFTLRRSEITDNSTTMQNGGIRIEQIGEGFSKIDVLIDSCRFMKNHADVYGTGRIAGGIKDFIVSNSIFNNNTALRYTSGPAFITNAKGQVYNCIFHSNYSQYSDTAKTAQGATVGFGAEVEFFNCTFTDTSSADGIGLSVRRGGIADLANCILWGTGHVPMSIVTAAELGCTVNVNYCDIQFGMDSISVSDSLSVLNWGAGNISEDPLFADVSNADFHLEDSSPCIGAGINSFILNDRWYTAPTRDIEGNKRPGPENSQADIGAYENPLGGPVNTKPAINDYSDIPGHIVIWPNPFSHNTTISYNIPVECYVNLSIYSLTGQLVTTLVSEVQPKGIHSVLWDGTDYSEGHYFYRLETRSRPVQSGIILLVK